MRVWSLALLLALAPALTPAIAAPDRNAAGSRGLEPKRRGSEIRFFGWSPDSKYVAYLRLKFPRRGGQPELQRMHRQVLGGEFTGFGTMVGGDVESHARRAHYVATPLPWRRISENRLELALADRLLYFDLDVGREHGWRLTHEGRVLASHRFDRIYVGFQAEVYPSPDGRQAIIVMHLDSGWDIDAAAYPVDLSSLP